VIDGIMNIIAVSN